MESAFDTAMYGMAYDIVNDLEVRIKRSLTAIGFRSFKGSF